MLSITVCKTLFYIISDAMMHYGEISETGQTKPN